MDALKTHLVTSAKRENAVNHASLNIELLTKSYEHFKKMKNGRTALFVANEIARIYQKDSKNDIALRFYERISKSYRKDKWNDLLFSVCLRMAECAASLNVPQKMYEALLEQIATCPNLDYYPIFNQLINWTVNPGSFEIDMDQFNSFLNVEAVFNATSVHVQGTPYWQVIITNKTRCLLPSEIKVSKVTITFSDSVLNHDLYPALSDINSNSLQLFVCDEESNIDLSLKPLSSTVIQKKIHVFESGQLSIKQVSISLVCNQTQISLMYNIGTRKPQEFNKWLSETKKWIELPSISKEIRYFNI
jgi:hypothetical protein